MNEAAIVGVPQKDKVMLPPPHFSLGGSGTFFLVMWHFGRPRRLGLQSQPLV